MANGFRGFARMMSTVKNSTRKEGLGRMFSSKAQKSTTIQKDAAPPLYWAEKMKKAYGDRDPASLTEAERYRVIKRQVYIEVFTGVSVGSALGLTFVYIATGWYPYQATIWGDKNHALEAELHHALEAEAMKNLK
ncbi:hypothetical protein MKW94_013423 [Papaver nudicaule]|uniref:Uncharacterized protein n=1 Tax=Papaver nudicaule TaxID=74823 RepID=A0AA41VJ87_PAPNU|nr:hypothetical protein [Papaver nudicaule]